MPDIKPRNSLVFEFEGQIYFIIAFFLTGGAFFFAGYTIEYGRHGSISFGEIIIWAGALLFFFGGILIARRQSDILIDDAGISRRIESRRPVLRSLERLPDRGREDNHP